MRYPPLFALCCLTLASLAAQESKLVTPEAQIVSCTDLSPDCSHKLVNGFTYKTLVTPRALITISLADNGKYTRVDVMVTNTGQQPFDILPTSLLLSVTSPKAKALRMVPPEKIMSSERHSAGWANAINALGAGMATQQVTTQTNSSGTVQATNNNGGYANGTYNGTSNSTTSVPDYAAQARARENIARRRETLAAHQAQLEQTVLRGNTVEAGRVVGGFVFFESEKHGENYVLDLPLDGTIYRFPLERLKH